MRSADGDDIRRDRLRQQLPGWLAWFTYTSDVRTQWAVRPMGSTGQEVTPS